MMAKRRFVTGEGAFGESSVTLTVIQIANTLERTVAVFASRIARARVKNGLSSRRSPNVPVTMGVEVSSHPMDFAGVVENGFAGLVLLINVVQTTSSKSTAGFVLETIVFTFTFPGSRHLDN